MKRSDRRQLAERSPLRALLIFFLCAVAAAPAAFGQVEVRKDPDFHLDLTPHLAYFVDGSAVMPVEEASKARFSPLDRAHNDIGQVSGRAWFRTTLRNPAKEDGDWRLAIGLLTAEDLQVWMIDASGRATLGLDQHAGDVFASRPVRTRYLSVDLRIPADSSVDLLISHKTAFTQWMPLSISTIDGYYERQFAADVRFVASYAGIATVALFIIAMTPVLGWRLSIAASAALVLPGLRLAHIEGFTYAQLWPEHPSFNPLLWAVLGFLPALAHACLVREFLQTRKTLPGVDKWLIGALIAALGLAISALFIRAPVVFGFLSVICGGLVIVLALLASILALRGNLPGVAPFLAGSAILSIAVPYGLLTYAAPGAVSFASSSAFAHLQYLFVALAMLVAIVSRILDIHRGRNRALSAELAAAREKMKLTDELHASQRQYSHIKQVADARQQQLAHVGHDIRQPLRSLRTALDRVSRLDEAAATQMHAAFDYLEDLARSNAGSGALNEGHNDRAVATEVFPLRSVLDNVCKMFAEEAAARDIRFCYVASSVKVWLEPIALMRVVSNLVANAVRHTSSGRVLVGCRRRGSDVVIEIRNTGPGMDQLTLERMLEPGEKGQSSTGTGLGLPISKQICDAAGFEFTLDSRLGAGVCARVRIPRWD